MFKFCGRFAATFFNHLSVAASKTEKKKETVWYTQVSRQEARQPDKEILGIKTINTYTDKKERSWYRLKDRKHTNGCRKYAKTSGQKIESMALKEIKIELHNCFNLSSEASFTW